jgi:hypothetical protein
MNAFYDKHQNMSDSATVALIAFCRYPGHFLNPSPAIHTAPTTRTSRLHQLYRTVVGSFESDGLSYRIESLKAV